MPATQVTLPETISPSLPAVSRIALTGFMGAGKTTVGRMLAERLGYDFFDLDQLIEARAGMTIGEIFQTYGEPHFRLLESRALVTALGGTHRVIGLGGGTAESTTNRLLLEQTPDTLTVFLDAPFATLYDRCRLQDEVERPLLADIEAARVRYNRRQPLYRRLAQLHLPTNGRTPDQILESLLPMLARHSRR